MTPTTAGPAVARTSPHPLVRWAELDIARGALDDFKAAASVLREAVVRTEPGVDVYHAVSEAKNPTRVHVLEMYADAAAYETHIRAPHFVAFRTATEQMVTSRRLYDMVPVRLGTKAALPASPWVRIALLQVEPTHLQAYEAAVSEEIDNSIRVEPGVLTLYCAARSDRRNELGSVRNSVCRAFLRFTCTGRLVVSRAT